MSRTSEAFKNLKKVIPAITFARKADVKKYLKAFNLDLDREEHKCAICGRKITPNNIGIIVSDGGKTLLICDSCIDKVNFLTLYEYL